MPAITCPSPDELRQLVVGQLAEAEASRLEKHVASCASCLEVLDHVIGVGRAPSPRGSVCHQRFRLDASRGGINRPVVSVFGPTVEVWIGPYRRPEAVVRSSKKNVPRAISGS